LTVIILALPGIALGYVIGGLVDLLGIGQRQTMPSRVRMIGVPHGDEPREVRAAWVGLVLPLAPGETGSRPQGPSVEGEKLVWVYFVDAPAALAILAEREPDAAAWWRENAPERFQPGERLAFAADVCELELPGEGDCSSPPPPRPGTMTEPRPGGRGDRIRQGQP
jgi:hypothetical protein